MSPILVYPPTCESYGQTCLTVHLAWGLQVSHTSVQVGGYTKMGDTLYICKICVSLHFKLLFHFSVNEIPGEKFSLKTLPYQGEIFIKASIYEDNLKI